jgi:hypothetical protein
MKVVPLSKRQRHLKRPCEVCAGTGEVADPPTAPVDVQKAKEELAAVEPLKPQPVVVDFASIMRALGGWATPRD